MNVLLLGSDPRHESILNGLAAAPGHGVEYFQDANTAATNNVTSAGFDALICAGPLRPLLSLIREFLADGKPVMVIPSAVQGSEAAYELLAIDEESGGRLIAGFAHRYAGAWRDLRERIRREPGEAPDFIQMERWLPRTRATEFVPHADVDEFLLRDADLLRWLGTDYREVTCLYTGASEAGVSRATVNLAGDSTSEANWTLELHGDEECRVRVSVGAESESAAGSTSMDAGSAAGLLADLERVAAGRPPEAVWMDAVRAFDVVDAARRSVRRRRTVEISAGEVSERGQFKTKMTALGCSLLSFTLLGVVLALLIGAVFDPRDAMQRQSEAAGFVLEHEAFVPGTAELTQETRVRLIEDLSLRLRETPAEIIVESAASNGEAVMDDERRDAVVEFLLAEKAVDVQGRVVVRPLAGRGFQRFMTGLWIVVFLPLGVFLVLQALIVVTRSADREGET